jgi:single-strand DNA-binding protein
MATRNLNKVMLIGNLTRDPEMRFTPQGNAVASFVVATNREWLSEGERKQAADFHNVVSWNKLAEICGQLLQKGTKVYVEGRLQTRNWDDPQGQRRYKTEVVIDDMIVLARKKGFDGEGFSEADGDDQEVPASESAGVSSGDADDVDFGGIDFDDLDLDSDSTDDAEKEETEPASTYG